MRTIANRKNVKRPKAHSIDLPRETHANFVADLSAALHNDFVQTGLPVHDFKVKWLQQNLLSKFSTVDKANAAERKAAAIEKWLVAEFRNAKTNQRLLIDETSFGTVSSQSILLFAKNVIRQVLGDEPPTGVVSGLFTNGASTRVKRGPTAIATKYVGKANITEEALPIFLRDVLPLYPQWAGHLNEEFSPTIVPGSVMFTVPKNSEIDRVACKEPELNMFMQRGIGDYIRSCLRSRGIDLNDQSRNRKLAQEGSLTGHLATLDLTSASDLISTQLVAELLSPAWFVLLDSVRVKRTLIGEEYHELNMFSSMGNGFTFELESLIFYALSCAINFNWKIRGRVSVYGDDIITPTRIARVYPCVFAWFGFIVNMKKSFWNGGFRESCGGHYFDGVDVTPFYIKESVSNHSTLIQYLNQWRLWCTRSLHIAYFLPACDSFWEKYAKLVPKHLHGGKDIESVTSLVTTCTPKKELYRSRSDVKSDQLGGYLWWLHEAGRRNDTAFRFRDSPSSRISVMIHKEYLRVERVEHKAPLVTSRGTREHSWSVRRNRVWERSLSVGLQWPSELAS